MGTKQSKTVKRVDQRPKVKVVINGMSIVFLYDTGADNCYLDKKVFDSLKVVKKNYVECKDTITSSLGKPLTVNTFICDLDISIDNKQFCHPFTIVENCNERIIGIDFIHAHCLQYNVLTRSLEWKEHYPCNLNPFEDN